MKQIESNCKSPEENEAIRDVVQQMRAAPV